MEGFFPQTVEFLGIPISDTVYATWAMMAIALALIVVVRRLSPEMLEMLIDFVSQTIADVMGRPSRPFLPFLGALAIFIAIANTISSVPLIDAPTRGINTPVALAIVVFFSVHYFGIRAKGLFGYLKDLASPIFLLPLEIIGQISRTVSLAIRLFGNILSTELIVAVVFSLIPLLVPLPLIGLNAFTGLLQAYIFTTLAAVYISTALDPEDRLIDRENHPDPHVPVSEQRPTDFTER